MKIFMPVFDSFKKEISIYKFKRYLLLFITFLLAQQLFGQSSNFHWAKAIGGISNDVGNSVSVDASGNVYTTGSFSGIADFDPNAGTFNLTSYGSTDIFISKLNPLGNFIWAKQIGGVNADDSRSIVIEPNGNILVTGNFFGTVDFDPGAGVFNLDYANGAIFICKLDLNGNFIWAKQLGTSIDRSLSITVDKNHNVYTTGYFFTTADYDPGPGIFNLTTSNYSEIFISKLDASGNFIWAKQMGGSGAADAAYSIAVDTSGNVYTTGSYRYPGDFDPGPGTFILGNSHDGIFVSKLNSSGDFVWAKAMGATADDWGYSLTVDSLGNVYSTGRFFGIGDFDPGAAIYNLTSNGNIDIFISKLDASGNFQWAKQIGGPINDVGKSIKTDISGNVYLTGLFESIADFDPGPGTFNLTSFGIYDIFVSKLDALGNFTWARNMGGVDQDEGNSITLDNNGNIYATGFFNTTANFNSLANPVNLTSAGSNDVFVLKLDNPIVLDYLQVYLKKAQILQGQTDSIWGKKFTPNGQIKITIRNYTQQSFIADTTFNANGQGTFDFDYNFISTLVPGIYSIILTDLTSSLQSYDVRLIVNSNNPIINRVLKVTSPIIASTSNVNKFIKISWSDIPSHLSNLIAYTSLVNTSYKLEYNKDNSGWQLITNFSQKAFYSQLSNFIYNFFIPSQPGVYQFRVTDNIDVLNTDISSYVTVINNTAGVVMNYEWDSSGNQPISKPIGLVSDGTSRIYVKILKKVGNTKTINNVTLTVSDPLYASIIEPRLLGKLKIATDTNNYSIQANDANSISISSSTSGSGNVFWFWYVAPDDFVRDNNSLNDTLISNRKLSLQAAVVYSDNSMDNVTEEIEIVRPPLMFVHGIGGEESTWDNFYYKLNGTPRYFTKETDSRWKIRRALHMHPGGSYIENARLLLSLSSNGFNTNSDVFEHYNPNSFQFFLFQMRNRGYACNKVDYIAHSMGGDMARTAINYFFAEYKPSVQIGRKFKNYGKGFINKFITLNTPHNGNPLADWAIPTVQYSRLLQSVFQGAYVAGFQRLLISSFFKNSGVLGSLNFNAPTEALQNLRFGPNGVKFLQTDVKNHLLAGDILAPNENCMDVYHLLKSNSKNSLFYNMFKAITGTGSCIATDLLFALYGVNDFVENGDFVVPLRSQLPGKNLLFSGTDYTIYYGANANHMDIHTSLINPSVGQKVFSLLNSPINSPIFADNIVQNSSSGPIVYKESGLASLSEWIDTNKIVIRCPVRNSNYLVDSSISISIHLKDTFSFKRLNLLFQSEIYSSTSKATYQLFNVQANPIFIDAQTIVASAVYDSLGYDVFYTDTLSINILKDTVIHGFFITPKTKYLNSAQTYIPTYNLIHNSYISNVSIVDTALHVSIADTNVVTYSNIQKNFIAKDTGTTYAIISYKQFNDTLFIIIDTTTFNVTPLPIKLISFTGSAKQSTNLLEWETTAEINYSHFILQRSLDGNTWRNIGRINSISISPNSTNNYYYSDSVIANSLTFYRLLLVDIDGNYKISNIVVIRRSNNSEIKVFPNPVTKNEVFVDLGKNAYSSKITINLVDLSGKNIKTINQVVQSNNVLRIDLKGLKPAIYFLKIQKGNDLHTFKLVGIE